MRRRENGARERDTAAERERYRNNKDAINKRRRELRAARSKNAKNPDVAAHHQDVEATAMTTNGLEVGKQYEFIQPGALKAFVWEDPDGRLNTFGIRVPPGTKFQVLEMHWMPAGAELAPAVKVSADIPTPKTSARGHPIRDVVLAVGRSVLATGAAQPVSDRQMRQL